MLKEYLINRREVRVLKNKVFQNESELYHYYEQYINDGNQSQLKLRLLDLAKNRVSEASKISRASIDAKEESTSKQEETIDITDT